MKIILFLFCSLTYVATAASQTGLDTVCTEPFPVVDNAEVTEDHRKDNYTKGSLLPFSCRLGYVSAGRTVYSCSDQARWARVREGKCVPRPCELPEDIPNGSYDIIEGTSLVFGAAIKYTCNEGYQMMSRSDTRVCMLDGWSSSPPVCEALSCQRPKDHPGLILRGLPEDDSPILYGHKLQFECAGSGMAVRGEPEIICTSAGQWSHHLPKCEVVTCEVGKTDSSITVRGLPANGEPVKYGETLHFTCAQQGMAIRGQIKVTCTSSGKWNAPFPKCEAITCAREGIHSSVHVRGLPLGNSPATYGTELHFSCVHSNSVLHGMRTITCLENGQWSGAFPKCVSSGSCGPPPPVTSADIVGTQKQAYKHGDWVKFQCQKHYILEGSSPNPEFMWCSYGQWNNQIRCLQPCIMKPEVMDEKNIEFKHPSDDLRYVKHGNQITFVCKAGMRKKLNHIDFAQKCNNGHMNFPECY